MLIPGILSHGPTAQKLRVQGGNGRQPWSLSQEPDLLANKGKPRKRRRKEKATHRLAWLRRRIPGYRVDQRCPSRRSQRLGIGGFIGVLLLLLLLLSRFSRVRLCATPEMAAHQAPLSLGFSRQEHWSGLPFPSPMHESEK